MRDRAEIEAMVARLDPVTWDPYTAGAADGLKWALGEEVALDSLVVDPPGATSAEDER